MTNVTLQTIHREITEIKNTLEYLKHLMKENYELSDWAKKEIAAARRIPDAKLISHEELRKKILGR